MAKSKRELRFLGGVRMGVMEAWSPISGEGTMVGSPISNWGVRGSGWGLLYDRNWVVTQERERERENE